MPETVAFDGAGGAKERALTPGAGHEPDYGKLSVGSRTQAVARARDLGLLP